MIHDICTLLSLHLERTAARRSEPDAERIADEDALSMLVHDIRSPMQGIVGHARLLRDGCPELERDQQLLIQRIIDNGEYVADLAERILAAGGLDASRLVRTPIDSAQIANCVLQRLGGKADSRRIQLVTTIPASLPFADADPFYLGEALQNLVDNAIDASQEGSIVRVSARLCDDRRSLRVTVSGGTVRGSDGWKQDSTIPPRRSRSRRLYQGLGLSIVKRIVLAHGGHLSIRARHTGTITAAFTIPVAHTSAPGCA